MTKRRELRQARSLNNPGFRENSISAPQHRIGSFGTAQSRAFSVTVSWACADELARCGAAAYLGPRPGDDRERGT